MAERFLKDPDAVLDYGVNWSDWLEDVNDTIDTATWAVPAGITTVSEITTTTGAYIWVSGGTVGESYAPTNHIVTAAGREDDRTITIVVVEK